MKMDEKQAVKEFIDLMVKLAVEEGNKFRQEYNRAPTESEAIRMADMIERQAKIVIACSR